MISNNHRNIPTVSVIMSIFKDPEEWLRESIESILNQTFTDFEFIIINDNPERTELKSILTLYKQQDSRVQIVENTKNIGLAKSLNRGLDYCDGEYIVRMDADDISVSSRIEKQITFMEEHPEVGVSGSWAQLIGSKEELLKGLSPIFA